MDENKQVVISFNAEDENSIQFQPLYINKEYSSIQEMYNDSSVKDGDTALINGFLFLYQNDRWNKIALWAKTQPSNEMSVEISKDTFLGNEDKTLTVSYDKENDIISSKWLNQVNKDEENKTVSQELPEILSFLENNKQLSGKEYYLTSEDEKLKWKELPIVSQISEQMVLNKASIPEDYNLVKFQDVDFFNPEKDTFILISGRSFIPSTEFSFNYNSEDKLLYIKINDGSLYYFYDQEDDEPDKDPVTLIILRNNANYLKDELDKRYFLRSDIVDNIDLPKYQTKKETESIVKDLEEKLDKKLEETDLLNLKEQMTSQNDKKYVSYDDINIINTNEQVAYEEIKKDISNYFYNKNEIDSKITEILNLIKSLGKNEND